MRNKQGGKTMKTRDEKIKAASERAAKIREFREKVIARRSN